MYDKYVKSIMDLYDKEQDEYDKLEEKELSHEQEDEEMDKISEKYDKLLLELNKKYNIIFRYDLADSWSTQLATLIITSDKNDNVSCVYNNEGHKKELDNKSFSVDSSKVLDILVKYESKLKKIKSVEDIPVAPVLDGVKSQFYFDIKGKTYSYSIPNLAAWYGDIPENAQTFIDLLTELREVLIDDVDNLDRCLTLL